MKIKLSKKNLKNLSVDSKILPLGMTPNVGGGGNTGFCATRDYMCNTVQNCKTQSLTCPGGGGQQSNDGCHSVNDRVNTCQVCGAP